ncbi:response regulator transcription factor [Streptomyces sp. CBMA156]|uniref:response regulator transcription factor n=1 Tax=Streptomyces sp. CBMA156 TaxID=1930280 RepID=UPI00166204DD|nr:response regulator transcription factor [Streptomyces sp. CBMA156]MBD0676994.1 DNA-binding response regulator [Streptomyces sp. CBMA156]
MCAHVVVAEDDPKQADLARLYLEREGHHVVVVHDGRAALEQARSGPTQLLVLDVMMPVMDGLDVCRALRAESALPVLMLTARTAEEDLLLGLDLGADDYLTKPYSPRELVARVRALLRRGSAPLPQDAVAPPVTPVSPPSAVLNAGALTVDPLRHEVTADGRPVSCTPGEFRLLEVLAAQPGRVFTRAQLLDHLHGIDRYITARTVDTHVMNLRRKIEPQPGSPTRILTVYGIGYKLAEGPRGAS